MSACIVCLPFRLLVGIFLLSGCGRSLVDSSANQLDLTAVPFEGFQLTVSTTADYVAGAKEGSGELGYTLKGCEAGSSQSPSVPFSFARPAKVV